MIFICNHFLIIIEMFICRSMRNANQGKKSFLFFSYLQMVCLLGLRALSVGIDTKTYSQHFLYIKEGLKNIEEPGATLLIKFVLLFTNNVQMMFVIYAVLTIACMYYYIVIMSKDIYISVLLYESMLFYYFAFNGMRQALAFAITSVALVKLNQNRWLTSLMIIIVASSVHRSALIFLLVWLLKKIDLQYKQIYVGGTIMMSGIALIFGNIMTLVATKLFPVYASYLSTEWVQKGNILNPLLYMVLFLICAFYYFRKEELKGDNNILILILSIGVILYFMSIRVMIVTRIVYYFSITVITLLPNIISTFRNTIKKQWSVLVILCLTIYNIILIQRNAHGIMPYQFFWQQ